MYFLNIITPMSHIKWFNNIPKTRLYVKEPDELRLRQEQTSFEIEVLINRRNNYSIQVGCGNTLRIIFAFTLNILYETENET